MACDHNHNQDPLNTQPPTAFLLSLADDVVRVLQSLVETLSAFYEELMRSPGGGVVCVTMPALESVQLACHQLHANLAALWPCHKQFVAVLGRTGCGKSTLLNLLLSMTCASGQTYIQGIRSDSVRAVLRDSARVYGECSRAHSHHPNELEPDDAHLENDNGGGICMPACRTEYVPPKLMASEKLSFKDFLGICCARDRQSYMNKHVPLYDLHPFILPNGRMGDAGTTKVTSLEYGPKFVGKVRWITRKKLRKKLRNLRQFLDNTGQAMEEQTIAELREFWLFVRQLVGIPSSEERPTEEQIHMVIDELGNKRGLLDREELIQTENTKGSTIDRIFVREGLREKFSQDLGKLIEDLSIQVPVSSFESGISLLDVPGTNDPRVLHQRETRDAIDRTSLILLVLDKSVIDVQTEASLVDSLLLERMLIDETATCSLVVVGIAEKDMKKGLCPKDLVAGFDSKDNILISLKKIFRKIVSRLVKSKRIGAALGLKRIDNLFASSICLIPVLPFLCASLHLTISNPQLHKMSCESKGQKCCPLLMNEEEVREVCKETNIPQLLEKIHSVRVPPTLNDLQHIINSTQQSLTFLEQPTVPDTSYIEFLKTECKRSTRIVAKSAFIKSYPDQNVNMDHLECLLGKCADECRLTPEEIRDLGSSIGNKLLSEIQTDRFSLGPFIIRGFCPEIVGKKANELVDVINKDSQDFMEQALENLNSMRGDVALIDARFEKIADADMLAMAVNLHVQLRGKWELSLKRLRAKCFCGGMDGGLLGQVREALRKAYYGGLKYLSNTLIKQCNKGRNFSETLQKVLEGNEVGLFTADIAKAEIKKAVNAFWKNLLEVANKEIEFLWTSWQVDIKKLTESASGCLIANNQTSTRDKIELIDDRLRSLHENLAVKIKELVSLKEVLDDPFSHAHRFIDYGYRLLQSDSCLFPADIVTNDDAVGRNISTVPPLMGNNFENDGFVSSQTNNGRKDFKSSYSDSFKKTVDGQKCASMGVSKCVKTSRKAQVLSEDESHKLQKRESNIGRSRKYL